MRIQQLEKRVIHLEALNQSNLSVITMQERTRARFQERISQLESDKQQLEGMLAHMNQLRDAAAGRALEMEERVHQLEAERDAALADFKLYRERNIKGECGVYACDLCKRGGRYEDWDEIKCPTGCTGVSHWEWRGVQKEGSKE